MLFIEEHFDLFNRASMQLIYDQYIEKVKLENQFNDFK